MSKLTARQIEYAEPKDKEYRLPDDKGIFLRVRTSGAKSWLYCFRLPSNRTLLQMTLGSFKEVALKEARNKLPELRKLVAQDIDPRTARAAAIAENTQTITMQALFESWIELSKLQKKSRACILH